MSLGRDKDAERRAEAAFTIQSQALAQQQQFLQQQAAESQQVEDLLRAAETGNQEARQLLLGDLNRAVEGQPNAALNRFLTQEQQRTEEVIRRNVPGGGGESSSPGIALQESSTVAQAAAVDAARNQDIAAAVGGFNAIGGVEDARVARLLQAINNPLIGATALGQNAAQFGSLNQFTPDTFGRDLGVGALNFLASQPNAISNIGGNISGIGNFLSGGRIGTSFKQQRKNAFIP